MSELLPVMVYWEHPINPPSLIARFLKTEDAEIFAQTKADAEDITLSIRVTGQRYRRLLSPVIRLIAKRPIAEMEKLP